VAYGSPVCEAYYGPIKILLERDGKRVTFSVEVNSYAKVVEQLCAFFVEVLECNCQSSYPPLHDSYTPYLQFLQELTYSNKRGISVAVAHDVVLQKGDRLVNVQEYAQREPEWITSGDTRLAATVDRRDLEHWMIGVHGGHSQSKRKGARWAHLCELAERLGWSFAAFDLRDEDGDSEPHLDATITQSRVDLDLVIQTLVPEDGKVVLWGHSRGAFVSFAWAATRQFRKVAVRKVVACILVAPAWGNYARFLTRIAEVGVNEASFREMGEVSYLRRGKPQTRTWDDMEDTRQWDRLESLLATSFTTPTLVIHSRNDEVIPYELSEKFGDLDIWADVRITPRGDHQFKGHEEWLISETEVFLRHENVI